MLTDLQRDILIKSREGIQEGLWCRGTWFAEKLDEDGEPDGNTWDDGEFFSAIDIKGNEQLEAMSRFYRCAEGEVAFRTLLAGGTLSDYDDILGNVRDYLVETCPECEENSDPEVEKHNDMHMEHLDRLEGGQEWARIFDAVITNSLL